jgi:hypothetical protein
MIRRGYDNAFKDQRTYFREPVLRADADIRLARATLLGFGVAPDDAERLSRLPLT